MGGCLGRGGDDLSRVGYWDWKRIRLGECRPGFPDRLAVGWGENPCGLAITGSGIVYYAAFSTGFTGTWAFHKLNSSNGKVTDCQELQDGNYGGDAFIRMYLSSDNTRVFPNMSGVVFSIDTATDTFFFNPILQFGADYELTLSSNQTWTSSAEYLLDTNLNPESYVV
jgi:hypothetical protein